MIYLLLIPLALVLLAILVWLALGYAHFKVTRQAHEYDDSSVINLSLPRRK